MTHGLGEIRWQKLGQDRTLFAALNKSVASVTIILNEQFLSPKTLNLFFSHKNLSSLTHPFVTPFD